MTVIDFINSVRFPLGDTNKMTYSDAHIIDTFNAVLSIVNNALVKLNSNIPLGEATLIMTNGKADLPDDFISLTSVKYNDIDYLGYKIKSNKIYTDVDKLDIEYRLAFPYVNENDIIPVPDYFSETLKRFLVMIMVNNMSIHTKEFFDLVYFDLASIVSGREYASIERPMPFIL